MKWVAVARNGLILWENDATGLRIILKMVDNFWGAAAVDNLPD